MVLNQEFNTVSFLGRESQANENVASHRQAGGHVVLRLESFADVVQQQRKKEQFWFFQLT